MTLMAIQPPDLSSSAAAIVQAAGLGKRIDERPILRNLSFQVEAGQCVAVLGANGAGKSTLLRVLATLTSHDAGELLLFGRPVRREAASLRGRIGLIGHQAMLYRDLSARENLEFFGRLYGVAAVRDRAAELLATVGLSDRADDAVKSFSRGMTQRVAIARALMHDPQLILADEPFAGLDTPSSAALEKLLAMLHGQGRTILLVNHDIEQSLRIAQRVIVLRAGQMALDAPSQRLTAAAVVAEVSR